MPQYGEKHYWNERYAKGIAPFDWMCGWDQLQTTIRPLLKQIADDGTVQKQPRILIAGCGNAPFSSDLYYKGGYKNQINIDYSEVVISQQKARFPEMEWMCMDALNMSAFPDGNFDYVIDKSLIDTTMCYKNGHVITSNLFRELHRVLKPGGRLITISLHSEKEVVAFAETDGCRFVTTSCKLINKKQEAESDPYLNDTKTLFHTLAVFDKIDGLHVDTISPQHPLCLVDSVSREESDKIVKEMETKANPDAPKLWNPRTGLLDRTTSADQLFESLEAVLDDMIEKRNYLLGHGHD